MSKPDTEITYPFVPKSTRKLIPGQFWAIPLKDGRFACGRVIQLWEEHGKRDSQIFLAGLQDWVSDSLPTAESIAGTTVIEQGANGVAAILETGRRILGHRPLELDGIGPAYFLSTPILTGFGEDPCGERVMRGFEFIGPASDNDKEMLRHLGISGCKVLESAAEQRFGGIKLTRAEQPVSRRTLVARSRKRGEPSIPVIYQHIYDQIEFELQIDDVQIVILKGRRKSGVEANLLGFSNYHKLIWRLEPPQLERGRTDGFVGLWIRDWQVWVGSFQGFTARIDHRTGAVLESMWTK